MDTNIVGITSFNIKLSSPFVDCLSFVLALVLLMYTIQLVSQTTVDVVCLSLIHQSFCVNLKLKYGYLLANDHYRLCFCTQSH